MKKKITAMIGLFALALAIYGCCSQTYRFAWTSFYALNIDRSDVDNNHETLRDTLAWNQYEVLLDMQDSLWYASIEAPFQLIDGAWATTCFDYLYNHHDLTGISVRTLEPLSPDLPAGADISQWLEVRPLLSDSTAASLPFDSVVTHFNEVVNTRFNGEWDYFYDPEYDLDLRLRLKNGAPVQALYRLQVDLRFNDSTRLVAETRPIWIQ